MLTTWATAAVIQCLIKAVELVTGNKVPYLVGARRAGDPAKLVASAEKARRELGWQTQFAELEQIVESAWRWHRGRPGGYSGTVR